MPFVFAPLTILDEIAKDIYGTAKKAISLTGDSIIRNLEIGFSSYITNKYDRYSKIHTLLSPHEPVCVDDIYVDPIFDYRDDSLPGAHSIEFILKQRIVVVQAIAGHGKSMFLRNVFLQVCKLNHGVIPILLELRDIDFDQSNIVDVSYNELSAQSTLFSKQSFEALLKTGKILYLLDGFDEIKTAARKTALRKIDQLTRDFPATKVVVTSRPTDIFNGWNPSTIVNIRDYELPKIIELIERSPINGEIKDAFRIKVEQEYITTHRKFLANPLLCNMMILTFMRGGDIPEQKHIFYRKAFDTLFKHHDDMKFLYKRDYHSDLQEDNFIRLWRSFCYFSYMERKFSFNSDQLQGFIGRAAEYLSISVDKKSIADDFIESLCIIVKDGEQYSFLHRSFQEYAAAVFLCTERINNLPAILGKLNLNINDDALELAFLTNQELIEQEYILTRIIT